MTSRLAKNRERTAGLSILLTVLLVLLAACAPQQASPTPVAKQASQATPAAGKPAEAIPTQAPVQKPTAPAEKVKVKVGYSSLASSFMSSWVAKDTGIFDKYGLDVELTRVQSTPNATAALISGNIQFAQVGGDGLVKAVMGGADIKIIAGLKNVLAFEVYANPKLQKVEDLKGKKLGITRKGGNPDVATRMFLSRVGMEAGKDVTILELGGLPEAYSGLVSGVVDAITTTPPYDIQAEKAGYKMLYDITSLKLPYPAVVIVARDNYVAANQDVVERFLKSLAEAVVVIKTNPAVAKPIVGKWLDLKDEEVLQRSFEFDANIQEPTLIPTNATVQTILDLEAVENPQAANMKPEAFLDLRLVNKLNDSGFIKSLTSR